jgi:Fe-S-cluster containining protein
MLPGPYERWFTEICGRPSPIEARSTCERCAMRPGAPDLPPEGPYSASLRCCTYHPHLAPHFVGGILERGTARGRDLVRARIAGRFGVTPLGLGHSEAYAEAWRTVGSQPGAFGRRAEIRCPFYDGERCAIWEHRGPVCAAFHCKLDRGALGASLWSLLTAAFNAVERALARWLLARQALDASACDALLHSPADAALSARAWGPFDGREEEYFCEAARLIEPLLWAEVEAISRGELTGLSDALRATVARLHDGALPDRVRWGQLLHHPGGNGTVRLQHPSAPLDLLELPAALAERLSRPGVTRLCDLGLAPALARKLLDWQALVPSE